MKPESRLVYLPKLTFPLDTVGKVKDLFESKRLIVFTEEEFESFLKDYIEKKPFPEYKGWKCETSSTGYCDYEQEDGSYDEDNCRYCGEPDERK